MNKTKKKTGIKREWKSMKQKPRLSGENFRQWAERIGVSPEKVKEFKYWLIDEKKN